ncbi:MAG: glycosyltransferase family 2 protein [Candidatus Theseobacter exili]|nr:glycosyltransferase family 2 protein [Candidatus Theseobacter exili]
MVSVAMAVYNGEKYIKEQLDSIIVQLQNNDELIISYDNSTDNTWNIINTYASNDSRIKVVVNQGKGVVRNFENAIHHCQGKYIFFADQDDVWMKEKVEIVLEAFKDPKVTTVIHDACLTDEALNVIHPSTFVIRNGSPNVIHNFLRLSYIGCCLAFRSELKEIILPIPTVSRSHDWWTGTICSIFGKMVMIDKVLIYHRQHGNNATPKTRSPIHYQINVRWIIMMNAIKRCFKFRELLIRKLRGSKK